MSIFINVKNAYGEADTTAEVLYEAQTNSLPEISIIIPVYNSALYLEQCLDSVIAQTYKNIEIICIDDGSSDNSLSILLNYAKKDSRISIITQKNMYAGIARNAGISIARGKYFLFLDSDDFIEAFTLEKMYNTIIQHQADICISNADFYNDERKTFNGNLLFTQYCPKNQQYFTADEIGNNLYKFCTQVVWNKLISSNLIKRHQLRFQGLKSCNDTAFGYLILSTAHKFAIVNDICVHYRSKHTNHISSKRGQSAIGIIKAFLFIENFISKIKKISMLALIIENFNKHLQYDCSCCSIRELINFKIQSKKLLKRKFNLFKNAFPARIEKIKYPIIISLTSFPARINTVFHTINSLKKQIKCDKIILYLGKDKFRNPDLPQNLTNLIDDYFEIRWVERDLGPFTKLIPALKENPQAIIVTADDDIIYPAGWLKKLIYSYIKYPKNIHCHRIHKICFNGLNIKPYSQWKQEYPVESASYCNFLTGVGGVLYPPNIFNSEILNEIKFKSLTPYADDIWFWAMAVNSGVKIRRIQHANTKLTYAPKTQNENSLFRINNGLNKNDIQLSAIFRKYPKVLYRIRLEYLFNIKNN